MLFHNTIRLSSEFSQGKVAAPLVKHTRVFSENTTQKLSSYPAKIKNKIGKARVKKLNTSDLVEVWGWELSVDFFYATRTVTKISQCQKQRLQ